LLKSNFFGQRKIKNFILNILGGDDAEAFVEGICFILDFVDLKRAPLKIWESFGNTDFMASKLA
jgi:hypothetical protein